MTTCSEILQCYRKCKSHTCRGTIQFDIVTMLIRYRLNGLLCNCFSVQELRSEVENLASRVLYMQEAKQDVRSDISVMKRAAEKAHGEVTQAEQLKKKQVIFFINFATSQGHHNSVSQLL